MQIQSKSIVLSFIAIGMMSVHVWARPAVSNSDRRWLKEAANGQATEIALGRLAVRRASDPAVRRFGQQMIDDHSKAQAQVQRLARSKGVPLPTGLNAKSRATLSRLERLSARRFDRAYMQDMVEDHVEDVAEFRKESNQGRDRDVRNWARKTLPTLQMHLQMARTTTRHLTNLRR